MIVQTHDLLGDRFGETTSLCVREHPELIRGEECQRVHDPVPVDRHGADVQNRIDVDGDEADEAGASGHGCHHADFRRQHAPRGSGSRPWIGPARPGARDLPATRRAKSAPRCFWTTSVAAASGSRRAIQVRSRSWSAGFAEPDWRVRVHRREPEAIGHRLRFGRDDVPRAGAFGIARAEVQRPAVHVDRPHPGVGVAQRQRDRDRAIPAPDVDDLARGDRADGPQQEIGARSRGDRARRRRGPCRARSSGPGGRLWIVRGCEATFGSAVK